MAPLDDVEVTRRIVARFAEEFLASVDVDVVIGGAGPSGLVAGRYLADAGHRVVVFEKKLSPGGGMWGGGMTFPVVVVQESSLSVLDDFGIRYRDDGGGYYTADSVEFASKLLAGAVDAGVRIFNAVTIEDVMMRENRVVGVVVNWSAVEAAGLHVDPLSVRAKCVVDATGHPAEICHVVERKTGRLSTPTGSVSGERSMWAEKGEQLVVENTGEVFPGLFVAGMAANAVHGAPRMGPIFGGMLLSGKKVAGLIDGKLRLE